MLEIIMKILQLIDKIKSKFKNEPINSVINVNFKTNGNIYDTHLQLNELCEWYNQIANLNRSIVPMVSLDENNAIVMEWWYDNKKITSYPADKFMMKIHENGDIDEINMDDLNSVRDAFNWLFYDSLNKTNYCIFPCPLCGSDDIQLTNYNDGVTVNNMIKCSNCTCNIYSSSQNVYDVVNTWNHNRWCKK